MYEIIISIDGIVAENTLSIYARYQIVETKEDAWMIGSFVIRVCPSWRAAPAIKRSCNSGMSVIWAPDCIVIRLIAASR
jgi:hypothetical protein